MMLTTDSFSEIVRVPSANHGSAARRAQVQTRFSANNNMRPLACANFNSVLHVGRHVATHSHIKSG